MEHYADLNRRVGFWQQSATLAPRHLSGGLCLTRLFLDDGANPNALVSLGDIASHPVLYYGQMTGVRLLLVYGTSVDARRKWGWATLHTTARKVRGHFVAPSRPRC